MSKRILSAIVILSIIIAVNSTIAESKSDYTEWELGGFTLRLPSDYSMEYINGDLYGNDSSILASVKSLYEEGWPKAFLDDMQTEEKVDMLIGFDEYAHDDAERITLENGMYGTRYSFGNQIVLHLIAEYESLTVMITPNWSEEFGLSADTIVTDVLDGVSYTLKSQGGTEYVFGDFTVEQPNGWIVGKSSEEEIDFIPENGSVGIHLQDLSGMGITEDLIATVGYDVISETVVTMLLENLQGSEGKEGMEDFISENGLHGLRYWQDLGNGSDVLTVYLVHGSDMAVIISSANTQDIMSENARELIKSVYVAE